MGSAIADVCKIGKEDGNGASTADSLSTYETQPPNASTKRSSEAPTKETQESVTPTNTRSDATANESQDTVTLAQGLHGAALQPANRPALIARYMGNETCSTKTKVLNRGFPDPTPSSPTPQL
jgi:hypothetical protein